MDKYPPKFSTHSKLAAAGWYLFKQLVLEIACTFQVPGIVQILHLNLERTDLGKNVFHTGKLSHNFDSSLPS